MEMQEGRRKTGATAWSSRVDDGIRMHSLSDDCMPGPPFFFIMMIAQNFFLSFSHSPRGQGGGVAPPSPVSGTGCPVRTSYMDSQKFYGYPTLFHAGVAQ